MRQSKSAALEGSRLLVVEDDYFIAVELARALEHAGAEVVGPVGSVADALALLSDETRPLRCAVLDINLGEEQVYPLADALVEREIPFVFLTGYDAVLIPEAYSAVPRCEKPVDLRALTRLLSEAAPGGRAGQRDEPSTGTPSRAADAR